MLPVPVPIGKGAGEAVSAPLVKLMDVACWGIGKLYEPIGTIIQAKADRIAAVIKAEGDIEIQQLQQRAIRNLVDREATRQAHKEAIVERAKGALPSAVSDQAVDPDWITHFFEIGQDVSNEDMQGLFGRILAGEVTSPGKTSRRTLEFLKTMSQEDAEAFSTVIAACLDFGAEGLFFFNTESITQLMVSRPPRAMLPTMVISHLIDLNLLGEPKYLAYEKMPGLRFKYGSKRYTFQVRQATGPGEISRGSISLRGPTAVGKELARYCTREPYELLIDRFSDSLSSQGVRIVEEAD